MPRIPLEGNLDLTYRCNNNCRHCWLRIPSDSPEKENELTFDEIKKVVDESRSMGCRRWSISGGEPMLRSDFPEIFDYITRNSISYSLNTNGSLITPEIARLLKRKGNKMVSLYGATPEVHDHITRRPGSFEATMQGFVYMKEAGVSFIVQLIPMRDNYHQFNEMKNLAVSLSRHYRVGAAWLYLSACGDLDRNKEILRQRLDPKEVIAIDKPDISYEERMQEEEKNHRCLHLEEDDRLFASCTATRRNFHIDPYGQMTFCFLIKNLSLRYDLRLGGFKECWEEFIPSISDKIRGGKEYMENCASCEDRSDCMWCPVYGYLEHRKFSARVEYLCAVAKQKKRFKREWQKNHRRYYQIGGITIQVDSDLPIDDKTFHEKFASFRADGPGPDTVTIRHHFELPDLTGKDLGVELYRKPPWAIFRQNDSYIYLGISPQADDPRLHRVATFTADHTRARIYNDDVRGDTWRKGDLHSLTLFPSDQILIARLLADRQGCYLHSAGAIIDGAGMLFVGHSEAGKSTTTNLLIDAGARGDMQVEILCDDRNIVRRRDDGWHVYGTWSHGDVPLVSGAGAPLRAICFIEKANKNTITPLTDRKEITRRLLACVIKPFVTADWWNKTLDLIESLAQEATCYVMRFDKSGEIVGEIKGLIG